MNMKYLVPDVMTPRGLPLATTYSGFSQYHEHDSLETESKSNGNAITTTDHQQQQMLDTELQVSNVTT